MKLGGQYEAACNVPPTGPRTIQTYRRVRREVLRFRNDRPGQWTYPNRVAGRKDLLPMLNIHDHFVTSTSAKQSREARFGQNRVRMPRGPEVPGARSLPRIPLP